MKTKFWVVLLVLLVAVCLGLTLFLHADSAPSFLAEIKSDGKSILIVDLNIDQEFTVDAPNGGSNTITIKDKKIAVTAADCPDGYCMDRGFCNSGVQIVCLPHRLVISFPGNSGIDGAVG